MIVRTLLLLCVLALLLPGRPASAQTPDPACPDGADGPDCPAPSEPLCFPETRFCLSPGPTQSYFRDHGGPNVFGFPVSRPFRLRGEQVQLFQRLALRVDPGGQVGPLPLIDDRLLPLRRIDGVPLPAIDQALASGAPRPGEADFQQQADQFLQQTVPNDLAGHPIAFQRLYRSAPGGAESLSTGLAVFGWPLSPATPAEDGSAVLQRFEYAVFRYSAVTGESQILLLGDLLKSLLSGQGLSQELQADAAGSPLLRQYNSVASDGLQRPWELADTDLEGAFRPNLTTADDPAWLVRAEAGRGWPASANGSAASPADGDYQVEAPEPGSLDRAVSGAATNLQQVGDFVLIVDARLAEPGAAGYALYLRQRSPEDRYALLIDAQQRMVAFYRRDGGQRETLWDWTPAPALRGGTEPNRLMVRAQGNRFVVWANGSLLLDVSGPGPASGGVWLGALTWGQPSSAIFSNLRIATPE